MLADLSNTLRDAFQKKRKKFQTIVKKVGGGDPKPKKSEINFGQEYREGGGKVSLSKF